MSVLHSVAAAGLHVGETTNVGKWLNSSCLVFHACLFFSSYKVGMLRLGDRFVTLLNEFMLLIKCQFCFIYLQYFVIGLVILLILLSVFICFFFCWYISRALKVEVNDFLAHTFNININDMNISY